MNVIVMKITNKLLILDICFSFRLGVFVDVSLNQSH
jgi:hypothetical protein